MIRTADNADVERILSMDSGFLGLSRERARELLTRAIARERALVHVDAAGEIDGFVVTEPRGFFGRDFVELLAVHPAARRGGIGGRLLAAAAARSSTPRVFTSTNSSNAPMQALLATGGWTHCGTLTGLDEGDPELVYWLDVAGEG